MTTKLVRDGKVAVVYSPGFGGPWSTSPKHTPGVKEALMFDQEIALAVLANDYDKLAARVQYLQQEIQAEIYTPEVFDLEVKWVTQGSAIVITSKDGHEVVSVLNSAFWVA
jgi:hypothetical protein